MRGWFGVGSGYGCQLLLLMYVLGLSIVVVALACRVVCVLCINLAFRRYDSRCKGLSTFVYRSRAQRHKDTHDKMRTVRFFDFNGTIRIVACSSENLPRIRKSCGK